MEQPDALIAHGLSENNEDITDTLMMDQESTRAVADELAREFSIESLSAPAIYDAQEQIQTVALHMDEMRTQLGQLQSDIPALEEQMAALVAGAKALEQLYLQINDLAMLIDSLAGAVDSMNGRVTEAERDLSSTALKPLQAVLESLKMGPKGFLS